jgi:hypothetical protein
MPDLVRFMIFTLISAPLNYMWQFALERTFPGRKPVYPSGMSLPYHETLQRETVSGGDGLRQDEMVETRLNWANTMIKWLVDCMTIGVFLNTTAFLIIIGVLKGRSVSDIGSTLRTVSFVPCRGPCSLLCCAATTQCHFL